MTTQAERKGSLDLLSSTALMETEQDEAVRSKKDDTKEAVARNSCIESSTTTAASMDDDSSSTPRRSNRSSRYNNTSSNMLFENASSGTLLGRFPSSVALLTDRPVRPPPPGFNDDCLSDMEQDPVFSDEQRRSIQLPIGRRQPLKRKRQTVGPPPHLTAPFPPPPPGLRHPMQENLPPNAPKLTMNNIPPFPRIMIPPSQMKQLHQGQRNLHVEQQTHPSITEPVASWGSSHSLDLPTHHMPPPLLPRPAFSSHQQTVYGPPPGNLQQFPPPPPPPPRPFPQSYERQAPSNPHNLGNPPPASSSMTDPSYGDLWRENQQLQQDIFDRDNRIAVLTSANEFLSCKLQNLQQQSLWMGKVSKIPLKELVGIMEEYGSEVTYQVYKNQGDDIASILRQFRLWNPEFFEFFHVVHGKWVPKLGKSGELKRRARKRQLVSQQKLALQQKYRRANYDHPHT